MFISYIIPAFNESKNIRQTICSIQEFGNIANLKFEIIVIDNGSTDNTVEILKELKITFHIKKQGTVASLRNLGASQAKGDIYIFLDADVLLTKKWLDNIETALLKVTSSKNMITGSHVIPPRNNNWFHKYWFLAFAMETSSNHIGSAHLIITKANFNALNGFDETLETAEDFDLCSRARQIGIEIQNNIELEVIHPDFPSTVLDFIRREIWHGKGDCSSFNRAIRSKSLVASVVFYFFVTLFLYFLQRESFEHSVFFILLAILLLLLSSWVKFSHFGLKAVIINAIIFIPYYSGRLLSVVSCILQFSRH